MCEEQILWVFSLHCCESYLETSADNHPTNQALNDQFCECKSPVLLTKPYTYQQTIWTNLQFNFGKFLVLWAHMFELLLYLFE